jgi:hypothetical protein|tara:strand:+ start:686 stop:895 length:210 start_codon:yes stop_codon:yes gene_type:complete
MKLTNYNVQKDLYAFISSPLAMGIDTIDEQIFLTRKINADEEVFYPYYTMEAAKEDFQTIRNLVEKINV